MGGPQRIQRLEAGEVEIHWHESRLLAGNLAGDPSARELPIYVPHGARSEVRRLPVVFLLIGFTGNGTEFLEQHPWRRGVIAQFDQRLARGEMPPAILAMPNAFTRYGGSQYVDSSYLGPYARWVAEELVAFVEARVPTLAGRRGLVGKSSGGAGALHLAMHHPGVFQAVASISGDAGFEGCHAPAFWELARVLVGYGGDPARFVADFLAKPDLTGERFGAINTIAMSACYSPNSASPIGCDLPIDPRTGVRIDEVWRRWLAFDPVVACEAHAASLRALEFLHVEAGARDEYNIQFGTRLLARRFQELAIPHSFAEHDGGHRGIQERYLEVLPRVIRALAVQG